MGYFSNIFFPSPSPIVPSDTLTILFFLSHYMYVCVCVYICMIIYTLNLQV
jgi:hypothetical protein